MTNRTTMLLLVSAALLVGFSTTACTTTMAPAGLSTLRTQSLDDGPLVSSFQPEPGAPAVDRPDAALRVSAAARTESRMRMGLPERVERSRSFGGDEGPNHHLSHSNPPLPNPVERGR